MKGFPKKLTPNNLQSFKNFNVKRQTAYIRRYIYEKMLSEEFSIPDHCFVDLQKINIGDLGEIHYKVDPKIIIQIQKELAELGWKTSTAYGGTILFIYTEDKIPKEIVNANLF